MAQYEPRTARPVRRTPGGAVDSEYYYRIGKQRHDEELDEAVRHGIEWVRRAFRNMMRAGEIGTTL